MKQLKVGSDAVLRVDEKARWNIDQNPFTYVAHQLLVHIVGATAKRYASPREQQHLTGWRQDAIHLAAYSRETWKQWWAVARQAFLEGYPHPEEIKMLADPISKRPSQMYRVPSRIIVELQKSFRQLTNVDGEEAIYRRTEAQTKKEMAQDIREALPHVKSPAMRKRLLLLHQYLTGSAPPALPK